MEKRKFTLEHKQNLSKAFKGRIFTSEWKKKLSESGKGRIPWNTGKKLSEKHKEKISKANKGKNNYMFERKHLQETKNKIGISHIGKKSSDETRKKLCKINRGKNNAMYGKRGKNNPNYGRKHTIESKEKIGEAHKKLWKNEEWAKGAIELCAKSGWGKWNKAKDGTKHSSMEETKVHNKLKKKYGNTLKNQYKSRFDWGLLKEKKIIEYHPFFKNTSRDIGGLTKKEYIRKRLNLMKEMGMKTWKLIVLTNQNEVDKYIINN